MPSLLARHMLRRPAVFARAIAVPTRTLHTDGVHHTWANHATATWCHRLWTLMQSHNSNTATPLPPPTPTTDPATLLAGLRERLTLSHGRMPAAMVEGVWSLYDALLPPSVQADLAHQLTPTYVHNFFSFVQLMAEVALDESGIEASQATIRGIMARYRDVTAALHALPTTESDSSGRRAELHDALVRIKADLTMACVRMREVGAPLHYTWLRHTAALVQGMARLMTLRRTLFFFLTECKRRVTTLRAEQSAASHDTHSSHSDAATTQELRFWLGRQRDVELLDATLATLFHDFFSKEYLVLEEMTWTTTPPSLLEQIMRAETVQPFTHGMADMKARLRPAPNRHLYAFLHHAVVGEPLIAVQVALTKGVACSVDAILHRPTPLAERDHGTNAAQLFRQLHPSPTATDAGASCETAEVDTAIFYSINSAQSALRGLDLGHLLIKRAVRAIAGELNSTRRAAELGPITHFSTLSPIPGYVRWLSAEVEKLTRSAQGRDTFTEPCIFGATTPQEAETRGYRDVRAAVRRYAARHRPAEEAACLNRLESAVAANALAQANAEAMRFVIRLFLAPDLNRPWWNDHEFTAAMEGPLLRSVAHYLYAEKRRGRILDSVGNFHVSNGAVMYRLNFLANTTAQGSRESACVMVNYYYDLPQIESNVDAYTLHRTVAIGDAVRALLPSAETTQKQ